MASSEARSHATGFFSLGVPQEPHLSPLTNDNCPAQEQHLRGNVRYPTSDVPASFYEFEVQIREVCTFGWYTSQ